MNEWMNKRMNECTHKKEMNEWMNIWIYEWMWMNVNEWMNKWSELLDVVYTMSVIVNYTLSFEATFGLVY